MQSEFQIEALRKEHERGTFDCGEESLNTYIKQYAGQNDRNDIGRTFVMIQDDSPRILGYYTLSASAVTPSDVPQVKTRYPVPVAHIGRLAVDNSMKGRKLGEFLLLDALRRAKQAADEMAIYAVTVDALHEQARNFYLKYGFAELLDDPLHLFLAMKQIRKLDFG